MIPKLAQRNTKLAVKALYLSIHPANTPVAIIIEMSVKVIGYK
jgi:hypothetical protein